jgi:PAS domain S-box-containing protein
MGRLEPISAVSRFVYLIIGRLTECPKSPRLNCYSPDLLIAFSKQNVVLRRKSNLHPHRLPAADAAELFAGLGEVRSHARRVDWSKSPLGPTTGWSPALRMMARSIFDSPFPICLWSGPQFALIYNDPYRRILAAKHPAALGQPGSIVWAEIWEELKPQFEGVRAGGDPVYFEDAPFVMARLEGGGTETAYFNYSLSALHDEDGSVAAVLNITPETTDRVLNSERVQLALSAGAIIGTWFWDLPTDRFTIDAAFARSFGLDPSLGHSGIPLEQIISTVHPDDRDGLSVAINEAIAKGGAYAHQYRVKRDDGRYYWIEANGRVDHAEDGTPLSFPGVLIDVEDRRAVEAERDGAIAQLRALNDELEQRVADRTAELRNVQTFYNHSSECHAMLLHREDGAFEYEEINPATLRFYGMRREEVIGRTVDDLFEPDTAAVLNGHLNEALKGTEPHRYMRGQGTSAVEAVAMPIPARPGGRPRLAVTAHDISERLLLEEQLRQAQKMEAVGQLTGGLAHDFNNLLQGITGSLDRIQNRLADGRSQDVERFVKAALESANRAAALTHRLLAFSRRQTLDPRPADANKLITGMHELIARTMGPNIKTDVVGAIGLWPIRVDAAQLESALLNLCINARDAMPEGGRLMIETANKWLDDRAARERDLPPGQYVSVCVTDNGTGMPPDVIARAFDPFFTTKPLGKGTGLGLSMIYGFVRQSGGQVRIYSEIGKGTTMCLYFPRHSGEFREDTELAPEIPETGLGETVLVVDDEETVRMLVAETLLESRYKVLEAPDGPSALKIMESDVRIDLLITDVGLPNGLNGRQVADAARSLRKDLKVLFITGYAENAAVGNGHLDPGMAVLAKPFAMTTLANKVHELLEG